MGFDFLPKNLRALCDFVCLIYLKIKILECWILILWRSLKIIWVQFDLFQLTVIFLSIFSCDLDLWYVTAFCRNVG